MYLDVVFRLSIYIICGFQFIIEKKNNVLHR